MICSLQGFSDASLGAYAAVVYLKIETPMDVVCGLLLPRPEWHPFVAKRTGIQEITTRNIVKSYQCIMIANYSKMLNFIGDYKMFTFLMR